MKTFRELTEGTINKHLFYKRGMNIKFSTKSDGSHSLESRLQRANIDNQEFLNAIDKITRKLKSEDRTNYGIYFVQFPTYSIIGRYSKGQFLVITILTQRMGGKDYDKKYILEYLLKNFENEFAIIQDEEIGTEYYCESCEGEYDFWSTNVFEISFKGEL